MQVLCFDPADDAYALDAEGRVLRFTVMQAQDGTCIVLGYLPAASS